MACAACAISLINEPFMHQKQDFVCTRKSRRGFTRGLVWVMALGLCAWFGLGVASADRACAVYLVLTIWAALLFDWLLRRQPVPGDVVVSINDTLIRSVHFRGRIKQFRWVDIESFSIEKTGRAKLLHLQLVADINRIDRKGFWTRVNPARPCLPLRTMGPKEQQRLLDAVFRCVQQRNGGMARPAPTHYDMYNEEREFHERMRLLAPVPWVTTALILINVSIWGATLALGASALQPTPEFLLLWGGNAASEVQHGEWWRLLSATFLHGGIKHLIMNMVGLAFAGTAVERIYGRRQYLLLYLGSGLMGSALSLHFSAQMSVSVGASGAVFGIAGAYLMSIMQHRRKLPRSFTRHSLFSLGFFIVYSLFQGYFDEGIDNAAHIGGLVAGSLLALMLPARFDIRQYNGVPKVRAAFGTVLASALVVMVAMSAPPAPVDQGRMLAGQKIFVQAIGEYEETIESLSQEFRARKEDSVSDQEADMRSRTIHVPRLKKVHADLSRAWLVPKDPRQPLLTDTMRMTELLIEALEMPSLPGRGGQRWLPADPRRAAQIDTEMRQLGARIRQRAEALSAQAAQASRAGQAQ